MRRRPRVRGPCSRSSRPRGRSTSTSFTARPTRVGIDRAHSSFRSKWPRKGSGWTETKKMNELSTRDPETFWKPDAADRAEARASPQRSQTTNGRGRAFYVPIRPRGARRRPRRPPVVRAAIPVGSLGGATMMGSRLEVQPSTPCRIQIPLSRRTFPARGARPGYGSDVHISNDFRGGQTAPVPTDSRIMSNQHTR